MQAVNSHKRLLNKKLISLCSILLLLTLVLGSSSMAFSQGTEAVGVVRMIVTQRGIKWEPLVEHGGIVLTVSGPGDILLSRTFGPTEVPVFRLADASGDGSYTYELRVLPADDGAAPEKVDDAQRGLVKTEGGEAVVLSGGFAILDGRFVIPTEEGGAGDLSAPDAALSPDDVLHYDDVIITGSLCIGFDCANGESFGYCTVKLKENNLQLCFEDTSVGSFPTNDWKIQINDTTSGGASYFTLWDTTGGRRPFTIEAGAPAHSLYVEDYGRVGLGTSIPYVELHVVDGDSPTIRLDQDGSSGWTAQRWDMCGNETNFFIRDVTNGSKLIVRIQPNAPSNSLAIRSTGNVGIGTWSPEFPMEVERTGSNAQILFDRTDGAEAIFGALFDKARFGSRTNHPVNIIVNNSGAATFETDGDLTITNGDVNAHAFNPTSDVNAKENFATVDGKEVLVQLEGVEITTWNFKGDDVRHIGPTAQDFYAAYGLGVDDKHISTTDADGVALAAIKALNAQNQALEADNAALRSNVSDLEVDNAVLRNSVNDLETRMAALEARTGNGTASAAQPLSSNVLLIAGLLLAGIVLGLGLSTCLIRMARRDSGSSLLKAG